MSYTPRQMPRRFCEGMPPIVRANVLDVIRNTDDVGLPYDVIFRDMEGDQMNGLDFGNGVRGCHFFLNWWNARDYRAKCRRRRIAWNDLPEGVRNTITGYCAENYPVIHTDPRPAIEAVYSACIEGLQPFQAQAVAAIMDQEEPKQ